jgi:[acyl-carrier-protein] S-malonyltransferase
MLAAGVATWRVWKDLGGKDPDFMAGHSLGEYSALVAAGALEFSDAIETVAERGRRMQLATPQGTGSMAAILGLDDEVLERICKEASQGQIVSCANFNSPGQVVIAGDRDAVGRACDLALEAGARRALPLPVSVPSHCELMLSAADEMAVTLKQVNIGASRVPVIQNVDACAHPETNEIRDALVLQLWKPVRWSESVQKLIAEGVSHFVECGPGKVLVGLNRRISREVDSVSLVEYSRLTELLEGWS